MELSGTGFWHAKGAFRRRLIPLLLLLTSFLMASLLLRLAFRTDFADDVAINGGSNDSLISSEGRNNTTTATTVITISGLHRKLLKHASRAEAAVKQPNRIPGDRCTNLDIVISQGATTPLPNGIPTYTVEIQNQCFSGCSISRIHLSCGWFSSATMINPLVFKRLAYNDCLVNDGKPLPCGVMLSFQYANTFSYPLSVTSVFC